MREFVGDFYESVSVPREVFDGVHPHPDMNFIIGLALWERVKRSISGRDSGKMLSKTRIN